MFIGKKTRLLSAGSRGGYYIQKLVQVGEVAMACGQKIRRGARRDITELECTVCMQEAQV